jgi:hypothetical protein
MLQESSSEFELLLVRCVHALLRIYCCFTCFLGGGSNSSELEICFALYAAYSAFYLSNRESGRAQRERARERQRESESEAEHSRDKERARESEREREREREMADF